MTDAATTQPPPAPTPTFIGQATAVEQSRAVAEVQAAVVVARQNPRSVERATAEMRESFKHHALADRSFFAYRRGGSNITGPTIHMARELGRLWENVQWGINELRRDDVKGESEMIAWAWDLQANIRSSTTFIVKHARDRTGGGRDDLTSLRDIYENNANNGARRVREMIFAVLPAWFVDDAKALARKTLADGGGVPLPARRANIIKAFGELGVTQTQLVARFGAVEDWGDVQLANMGVLGRSIRDGETTVEEAFPRETERVTRADLGAPEPPAGAPATEPAPAGADPDATRPATGPQKRDIVAARKALGLDGDDSRDVYEALLSEALGRTITSSNDLSFREAKVALAFLQSKVASSPDAGAPAYDAALIVNRGERFGFTEAQVRTVAEELYARPLDELDEAQLKSLALKITYRTITPPPEES